MAEKSKPNVLIFQYEEEVAKALATYIANLSTKFVMEKGSFSVVLSGGGLIDTLRELLEPPYFHSFDWSKWLVFFLDERVVRLDHPDSNYRLAYDGFLSKVPIPAGNIYAINDTLSTEDAAAEYEARLKKLIDNKTLTLSAISGFTNFDLILVEWGRRGM